MLTLWLRCGDPYRRWRGRRTGWQQAGPQERTRQDQAGPGIMSTGRTGGFCGSEVTPDPPPAKFSKPAAAALMFL
ncbi:unnamed protein product [Merluccius merluccius]